MANKKELEAAREFRRKQQKQLDGLEQRSKFGKSTGQMIKGMSKKARKK